MQQDFSLPPGAIGRFAVVKLWPEIKTAEDECIARLKIAAKALGIECVEVHADGGLLSAPEEKVSRHNVDFVLHLHYDTPKRYDAFSIVALWNPLNFYHEWGYARTSRNLTSHDDFISCSSDAADDHVARMVRTTATHLPAKFHLYHSTADVIHPPSLGDGKLFYAGINWEAISGGKSRHQEVLKRLDKTGLLRIYGPTIFQGVRVWEGYDSYVREVPFDGVSMVDEISKAGVALVLSSQSHKDSELMSNRLFESVAAGALVICDENPFAKKFFGNSLLYIDSRAPIEKIYAAVTGHLEWAKTHPEEALAMITRSQQIFQEKFTLLRNLRDLYLGLAARKSELLARQNPQTALSPTVRLNLLMPEYSDTVLKAHIASAGAQQFPSFSAALIIDARTGGAHRAAIQAALSSASVAIEVVELDYFDYGIYPDLKTRRRTGSVISHLLQLAVRFDAFMIVAPNETLFSNHLAVLAGALQRDPGVNCAATAAVLLKGAAPVHSVHELIDFGHVNNEGPPGYGRFIFRIASIPSDILTALPYLDGRPLAVMIGTRGIDQQLPASIVIDLEKNYPERTWNDAAEQEVIRDYNHQAFTLATGFGPRPTAPGISSPSFGLLKLASFMANRRWITAQVRAIKKYGWSARFQVLKQRLGL